MTGRHDETGSRPDGPWHAPGQEHPSGPPAVEHPQADYGADYVAEPDSGPHAREQWRQDKPDYTGHPDFTGPGPHPDFTGGPEPDYGRHATDASYTGPPVGGPDQPPVEPPPAIPPFSGPPVGPPVGVSPDHTGQSGPYRVDQPYPPLGQQRPGPAPIGQQGPGPQGPGPQGPGPGQLGPGPGQLGPGPGQQGPGGYPQQPHDLSSAHLLRQEKRRPQSGWRRAVYVATGHAVNLGESSADRERRELIARINQPLQGCYKIAMLSLKGGVGKTTTTASLGSTFASLRGDRVIAVDANPDRGTLSQKIPLETTATVRHLLRDAARIRRYSDVRSYTSQGPSRLEVLASEQDPAVSEAFSEDDYRRTVDLLEHFYNIVLTDCGTGLMHSAMRGVLDVADSLVIVSSGSIDGARSASATLDWLDAHGYRLLVARSVAVINSVRPKSGKVDLDKVTNHFAARCRAVCRIPFDDHFEEGAEIELERLQAPTRLALLELAATVADDFPHANHRAAQQQR